MPECVKWHSPDPGTGAEMPGPVLAFLQARMGSTRLPGKTLMTLQGQTLLERAVRRLRAAPIVDEVVVLTTVTAVDDVIERESLKLGAPVYRGPEQDVLRRFHEAAEKYNPYIVVRATADNPLIDIGSIGRIVRVLNSDLLDFCMELDLPYGAATEALRAGALRRVHAQARLPRHREHVTLYMKQYPHLFRVSYPKPPEILRRPEVRLTVDTIEDFRQMERLIGQLPERVPPAPLEAYLALTPSGDGPEGIRRDDPAGGFSGIGALIRDIPRGLRQPDASKT
ncbi:MAG: NTP transferase domain-containing protein [Acidobacteria bacterium]|nr:NTP transferase domain-containing protein [Acidobacteriota bacterium]